MFDMTLPKEEKGVIDFDQPIIVKYMTEIKIYPTGQQFAKTWLVGEVKNINTRSRAKKKQDKLDNTVNDIDVKKVEVEEI